MKLTERWESGRPTVSFELFPARTPKAEGKLAKVIDKLAALEPDFVSVTFGAGGSTREGSHQLLRLLKQERGLEVLAYFAGFGLGPRQITEVLDGYREIGVENLLAVRGDPPEEGPAPDPEAFAHASDLLAFIGERYDLCLGAAGYPEGHKEADGLEGDLPYIKLKVERGARFIVANYFYDNRFFFHFRDRCHALGIRVPILPGVMPIFSVKMMESLAALCGATITEELRRELSAIDVEDKDALAELGVGFAARQCRELLAAGVPGLHIYTMDRARSAVGLVGRLRDEGLL